MDAELAHLAAQRGELTLRMREVEQALAAVDERLAEIAGVTRERARNTRLVPPWTEERRRQIVEPGHGAETARIAMPVPALSELSTAVGCPSGCGIAVLHSHYADGQVVEWDQKTR